MSASKILRWRPKNPVPLTAPNSKPLWTMHKQPWQVDCVLQGHNPDGWSIQIFLNGQWFFNCRFLTWADAMQAADDKQAELVSGGWVAAEPPQALC